jgi:Na+/H+ antiporter NhaC
MTGRPFGKSSAFSSWGFFGLDLLSTASVSVIRLTPLAQTDAVAASAVNMFVAYFLLAGAFVLFIFLDGRKTYRRVAVGFTHSADYAYVGIGFLVMIIINYVFSFLYSNFVPFYGANSNQVGVEGLHQGPAGLILLPHRPLRSLLRRAHLPHRPGRFDRT